MRFYFLTMPVLLLLVACGKKNRIPSGVLPQKKMQVVMRDMMRADHFLTDYVFNKDSTINKKTESLKYYQQVFAIHDISREQFQKSYSFYAGRPALFKAIMDSISKPEMAAPVEQLPALAIDSPAPAVPPGKDTLIRLDSKKKINQQ